MSSAPAPWAADLALLALRLVFGGIMVLEHGLGKLDKVLGHGPVRFADPFGIGAEASLWLATGAEVVCAGLVVLGLFTRLNCVPLLVTMGVAAFWAHGGDPLGDKEPALMYLTAFGTLFVFGSGRISVQTALERWAPKNRVMAFLLS